jgi:dihydroxyacid dehydratase/phosphogluconate dehydratase
MGAASVDLPTIGVSAAGPCSTASGAAGLGSGTGVWSMSEQVRAGTLKLEDFFEAESCMHRSHGHCMTMGTASTMASMVEALGIGLPGNAAYSGGRRPPQRAGAHGRAGASSRWCMRPEAVEGPHARPSRTPSARWRPSAAAPTP